MMKRGISVNVNPHDDIKARKSANEYLFNVLRLTTTGAARSVLLQFKPKYGRPGDGKKFG